MTEEKSYNIKIQDFIPLIGPFIYQYRNLKEDRVNSENMLEYELHRLGLIIIDLSTGWPLLQGLRKLLD